MGPYGGVLHFQHKGSHARADHQPLHSGMSCEPAYHLCNRFPAALCRHYCFMHQRSLLTEGSNTVATVAREHPWEVRPDVNRDPEEMEKEEQAAPKKAVTKECRCNSELLY